MTTLSLFQTNMNNASNAITNLTSNKIIYDFKIKNRLTAISKNLFEIIIFISQSDELKKILDQTRFRFCQKAFDAVFLKTSRRNYNMIKNINLY